MTINISQNLIEVKDKIGRVKFTSEEKLVYLKAIYQGIITVSNFNQVVTIGNVEDKDFYQIAYKILGSNGNQINGSLLVGANVFTSGSTIVNIDAFRSGDNGCVNCEIFGAELCGNNLVFSGVFLQWDGTIYPMQHYVTVEYRLNLYSYL